MPAIFPRLIKCKDEESCPYGTTCSDLAVTHHHGTSLYLIPSIHELSGVDPGRNARMHYHHLPDVEEYEANAPRWSKEEADVYRSSVIEKMAVSLKQALRRPLPDLSLVLEPLLELAGSSRC